jgi:chorismate mutase/prephenate dehydrogenase
MNMSMKLEKLRTMINEADEEIVQLIARRQSYMPEVSAIKRKENIAIFQPEREASVLASKKVLAKKFGVSGRLIESIFALIFKDSRRIQRKS